MITLLDQPDLLIATSCFVSGYILGRFGDVRGHLWKGHRHGRG